MTRTRLRAFVTGLCIVLVALALQLSAFGTVAEAGVPGAGVPVPPPRCFPQNPGSGCSPWHIVAGANISPLTGSLQGVAAIAADDVWAVGGTYDASTQVGDTLAEHWNGTSWSIVPTPNPNPVTHPPFAELDSVAATASNDVWAVGAYYNNYGAQATLIEHYDGTSWSIIPSPNMSLTGDELYSVAAISKSDAWAVGIFDGVVNSEVTPQTYTLHWNGTQWNAISSPNEANSSNELESIGAVSSTDVWAVGSWGPVSGNGGGALIEHWNGSQWSILPAPMATPSPGLTAMAVVSASNVWAVGAAAASGQERTAYEQWNGSRWTIVPSPSPTIAYLDGVAAIPGNLQLWAVGYTAIASTITYATLIEQYTPSAGWTQIVSPNLNYGTLSNQLYSVTAISATEAWAVGSTRDQYGNYEPLILHYVNTGSPPPWRGSAAPTQPSAGTATPGAQGTAHTAPAPYWRRLRATP